MKELVIGNRRFTNRFFLGTGKFASSAQMRAALEASQTQLVTTAPTRVREGDAAADDILSAIDRSKVEVMLNTSGARTADEAVRIAKIGKAAGFSWIKLEIHPDAHYLLPDPVETLAAAGDPPKMAEAFRLAVRAAELAREAGPAAARRTASATSPTEDIFA